MRAKATATAQSFAMRKQWEAKAASFQRGLEHVRHCKAGDACGSSLCHSTRRLMRTVSTHTCQHNCKVCKLWDFLTKQTQPLPRLPALGATCGAECIQPRRLRVSAVQRRIISAQKPRRF